MKKTIFILRESQMKYVIKNVLNEQENYSQHMGSTSAVRVSHDLLSNNFGLPDGSEHEDYYYSAKSEDILNISKQGDSTQFLSVFSPDTKYTTPEQKEKYKDYFRIGNEEIVNKGNNTYSFGPGQVVYASHNGLLALARAMSNMNGTSGYLTINLGKETKSDKVGSEMVSSNIILNNQKSFDISPSFNLIQNIFVKFAVNPNFYGKMKIDVTRMTPEKLESINYAQVALNNIISGKSGFLNFGNPTLTEEIINKLEPLGFKTRINFDTASIINELKKLSNIPDYDANNRFNSDKQKKISEIGNSYQNNLVKLVKQIYIENFKIFVKTYLPKYEKLLSQKIETIVSNIINLGNVYYGVFNSIGAPASTTQSTINISSGNYRPGG
jgi:hypothetical protein